jgi:hypothetical protein
MKPDLTTTSSRSPEIPFYPIKTMDQYFNSHYHRATMFRKIRYYMDCGRPAYENMTFCPLSDIHTCLCSSRHVFATYLAAPQDSWHSHLRSWNAICKWLLTTALYQIRVPVVTLYRISPRNWCSNRTCQYSFGTISPSLCVPPIGWLVSLASFDWVRHQ